MAKYCLKYTYLPRTQSVYDLRIHSLAYFTIPILWEKKNTSRFIYIIVKVRTHPWEKCGSGCLWSQSSKKHGFVSISKNMTRHTLGTSLSQWYGLCVWSCVCYQRNYYASWRKNKEKGLGSFSFFFFFRLCSSGRLWSQSSKSHWFVSISKTRYA